MFLLTIVSLLDGFTCPPLRLRCNNSCNSSSVYLIFRFGLNFMFHTSLVLCAIVLQRHCFSVARFNIVVVSNIIVEFQRQLTMILQSSLSIRIQTSPRIYQIISNSDECRLLHTYAPTQQTSDRTDMRRIVTTFTYKLL